MKPPQPLGDHRLIAGLGKGGMANVYLALSKKQFGFSKLVVLKLMRDDLGSPDFMQMFMHEARLAARLNHPNVVQTYEVGLLDGSPFISMEYLEGQPLSRVLQQLGREHVPLEVQLRVLCDALEGLHYAHELTEYDGTPLNIVHRDVSPQNTFVTYSGQTKIVDFGSAKSSGSERTASGILKGKTGYMAPEQASNYADRRSDVFAIGVMLWEAIARRRLATAGEEVAALARRIAGFEDPIRRVAPNTPPELADIVDRALAPNPAHRFQSAREMRDALESWLTRTRPCDTRQVAALLEHAFAGERTRIRHLIEQHTTAAVPLSSSGEVPLPDFSASGSTPRMLPTRVDADPMGTGSTPALPTGRQAFTADTLGSQRRVAAPATGPAAIVAVTALALVGLAGAGFLGYRKHVASKSRASATPSAAATLAPPPSGEASLGGAVIATSAAAQTPPSAAEPPTYVLSLSSTPPDAVVYSGGTMVGRTPLVLTISNASVTREPRPFVVKQEGYEAFLVDAVVSKSDIERHVALVRTRSARSTSPTVRPGAAPEGPATGGPRFAEPPDPRGLRPLDNGNPWDPR
jgi:serine/threonine-protein kinase